MIKTHQLQKLTISSKNGEAWRDWDIVLELDQREGDPAPAFYFAYLRVIVDWDDGNGPVTYTRVSTTQKQTYSGTYPVGKHIVKLKVDYSWLSATSSLFFGHNTGSTSAAAAMPQVTRVLKFDLRGELADGKPKCGRVTYGFNRCLRLEGVECPIHLGSAAEAQYFFAWCVSLGGKVAMECDNATNLTCCFNYCHELEEVDVRCANCANFQNFANQCRRLKRARLSRLRGRLESTFNGCAELRRIEAGEAGMATSLNAFANGCVSLEEMPELGDQPECTSLASAFNDCLSLREIVLGRLDACTSLARAFRYTSSLERLVLDWASLGNATTMEYAFQYSGLPLGAVELPEIPGLATMAYCFYSSKIVSLKAGGLPSCTSMANLAANSATLERIEIGDCPECTTIQDMASNCHSLRHARLGDMPKLATAATAFGNCQELEELEIHASGETMNNCANFASRCQKLRRLVGSMKLRPDGPSPTASYWNSMFNECHSLEEMPDIWPENGWASSFRVPSTQRTSIFSGCYRMAGAVPSWVYETWPGRTSQDSTFAGCFRLTNFNDLPDNWKGGNITLA